MDSQQRGWTVNQMMDQRHGGPRVRIRRARSWMTMLSACAVVLGAERLGAQESKVATHVTSDARRVAETLLARPVTLDLQRVSLEVAVDSLSRVSNVVIEYQAPLLKRYTSSVTLRAQNLPLGVALERALDGTALRVVPGEPGCLTIVAASDASADSVPAGGTVSGRIVDSATGRPINGATAEIAGTKISMVTRDSGRFTMHHVPLGDGVLSVRAFGYRPTKRAVTVSDAQPVTVRIALVGAPNVLSGVVTTATGVQQRRAVGNDITVINADSIMRTAPITSVTDLLATRVPGLTVARTSGVPGAPSRIRLRGIGSATMGNDPIVIVDGIRIEARETANLAPTQRRDATTSQVAVYPPPSALDQIDPNSIATIEVFKGPSATSQWGSDAGNGVIVITTKRGRSGPTHVSAALTAGMTSMPGTYATPGYFPYGKIRYFDRSTVSVPCDIFASALNTGESPCIQIDSIPRFQAANSARLSPFGTGTYTEGSATVSGGVPTLNYLLTGSSANNLGYFKLPSFYRDLYQARYGTDAPSWMQRPNAYKKWGATATIGAVPTSGLEATLGTKVTVSDQRQGSAQNDLSTIASTYFDTASSKVVNDPIVFSPAGAAISPYAQRETSHDFATQVEGDMKWNRWATLPIVANGGVQVLERDDRVLSPFGIVKTLSFADTLGWYSLGHTRIVTRTARVGGTVPVGHMLQAAVGGNLTIGSTESFTAAQDTLQSGVSEPSQLRIASQSSESYTTAGWYVEPRVKIGSSYISPGFRFDGGSGSNRTSSGNGSGGLLSFFPKLNWSWIAVDREGQDPLAGVITLLRPRLAFGVAGVQPTPQMRYRLMTDGLARGPGGVLNPTEGVKVSSIGNPDLHPERSREIEGGFDASLWGDRVSTTVTFYSKMRTDAIQGVSTAPSVYGGQPFYVNIGRIQNTGTELTLNARLIESRMFDWNVNGSLSSYKNKVVSLYDGASYYNGLARLIEGYPIDGYWSRPILGYRDVNHDGKIGLNEVSIADSAVFMGDAQPSAEIPFSTEFSLLNKRIIVNAGFDYKRNMTQLNLGSAQLLTNLYADPSASPGQQAMAVAAYAQVGSGSAFAAVLRCEEESHQGSRGTCYGLYQTVNVLRFNSLSVTVPVSEQLSRRLRVPHAAISLQASNLGLWTNYRGKDPDVNSNLAAESLMDTGQVPQPRTWTFRIDLNN